METNSRRGFVSALLAIVAAPKTLWRSVFHGVGPKRLEKDSWCELHWDNQMLFPKPQSTAGKEISPCVSQAMRLW